jgi:CRP-like cAMP-binding protein
MAMGGQTVPHSKNQLLARLGAEQIAHLSSHLKVIALGQGELIADTHGKVRNVYFPHTGIISCIVEMKGGHAIETGMIGNDGAFGGAQALDDKVSLNKVTMQVPGFASAMDADRLRDAAEHSKAFRTLLIEYELFMTAQVQQTAACNAVHNVQTRMCRWLLRMHELVGSDMPLTQEFFGQMMGVRRTSVTEIAGQMQRAGMISYTRGQLHIVDIGLVRMNACECHDDVRSHYERIMGGNGQLMQLV